MSAMSNAFAALALDDARQPAPQGSRLTKKQERAARHRAQQQEELAEVLAAAGVLDAEYTIFVDGEQDGGGIAVARGADGKPLAALGYSDAAELCSDDFNRHLRGAVQRELAWTEAVRLLDERGAASEGDSGSSADDESVHSGRQSAPTVSPSLTALSVPTSDSSATAGSWRCGSSSPPWPPDAGGSGGANGTSWGAGSGDESIDADAGREEFEAAWAQAQAGSPTSGQDHVLALLLQAEFEQEAAPRACAAVAAAAAAAPAAATGGAWRPAPTRRPTAAEEFPPLPAARQPHQRHSNFAALFPAPAPTPSASHRRPAPLRTQKAAQRSAGVRRLNGRATAAESPDQVSPRTLAAIRFSEEDIPLEAIGFRRAKDELEDGAAFLDAKHSGLRAAVLRSGDEAAQRAQQGGSSGTGAGTSAGDMLRMMGGGSAAAAAAAAAAAPQPTAAADGPEWIRLEYSRKSVRKLVADMFLRGWKPMPGRGGGHLMYERILENAGGKRQLLVLPCTPSDCKALEATHSRLQRLDREAEQARWEWAQGAAGRST